jgi:metal-responsive CopG/Arc/MetJ family transcriptional regulator
MYSVIKTAKRKTSISIDENLWKEWTKFVIDKTGSARKLSDEIENALKEYMKQG